MKPDDANWRYDALPHTGKCEIDGKVIGLTISVYGDRHGIDVLQVERVIAAILPAPSTVEGIADQLAEAFQKHSIQVIGQTDSHGPITVRIVR